MRSESLEWWTNIADEIVIVTATRVQEVKGLNEYHRSSNVSCRKVEGLRGSSVDEWSFRQDWSNLELGITEGQRLLLFLVREPYRSDTNPIFWVNLSKPDAHRASHAAYDNSRNHLSDEKKVLELVRARVTGEAAKKAPKKRGIIVPFWQGEIHDMYWDFVATADPEFKPGILKGLSSEKGSDPCTSIYNLISYPGDDTVKAIRPFLKDANTTEVQNYGSRKETIKYFPIRQAAYLALSLLGEEVEKPKPYFEELQCLPFGIGFEERSYFPYGDWKRLKE